MASTSTAASNGSYLQQADPHNFPLNATGTPLANYPTSASQVDQQAPEVPKDEVGWYFVEQYYTTLNKTPDRLHLFYNKRSTMVWGTEGESLPLAHGRPDIHEKISVHDFKDCKVRVSNVDSQASAGNGIVIQVLGEMSNNGLPNRKFSQTFFLAEQPNGYYVLNDIFRYLKDDDDIEEGEDYDYTEEVVEAAAEAVAEAAEEIIEEMQDMNITETSTVGIELGDSEKVKVDETTTLEPAIAEPEPEEERVSVNGSPEDVNGAPEEVVDIETKAEEPSAPVEIEESDDWSIPAPVVEEKPAPAPVKETTPAPAPVSVPARPKTWANLVAASAPTAVPITQPHAPATTPTPTAAAVAPSQTSTPTVTATSVTPPTSAVPATPPTPGGGSQWQTADSKRHSRASSTPVGQSQAYVKNVTEAVSEKALRDALTKFGNLKHFEISRSRSCAFVEFETPVAFANASAANPHIIGSSSVLVEERRRAVNGSYNRGGMSARGDGRSPGQSGRGHQPRDGQGGRGGRGGMRGGGGFGNRGGGIRTGTAGN